MEHYTARAEAERCLGISAKLLTDRDLVGSKTFAFRAKEADPCNPIVDQILAVVDTLIASEKRVINSTNYDWYSILQISHLVRDHDLIASQYGRLVMLLNPEHNGLPYADFALRLVVDAWSVLSDPSKKWIYDSELSIFLQRNSTPAMSAAFQHTPENVRVDSGSTFQFFQQPVQVHPQSQSQQWLYHHHPQQPQLQELLQQHHNPQPPPPLQPQQPHRQQILPPQQQPVVVQQTPHQPPPVEKERGNEVNGRARNGGGGNIHNVGKNGGDNNVSANNHDNGVVVDDDDDNDEEIESFWTTCPYCYYTYQYPKIFKDYTLRCQNCRRAFHAMEIPNPPPITRGGKETTFCCWGYFPLGLSMSTWKRNNPFGGNENGLGSSYTPILHVKKNVGRKPVVYFDDDDEGFDAPYPSSDSDSDSDVDWNSTRKIKKRKIVTSSGRGRVGRKSNAEKERMMKQNLDGVHAGGADSRNSTGIAEMKGNDLSNKAGGSGITRKQTRSRKKLDLNVEFSNEVEEHAPRVSTGNREEEVGFFEGLDEFLSTLPILQDDKAKPS